MVDHFLLLQGLATEGLTEDDIDFQGVKTDAAAAAFAGGQFDCVGVFAPFTLQALKRPGSHVVFSSKDFPGTIPDHLVATADAAADAEAMQKLVDAWYDDARLHRRQPRRGRRRSWPTQAELVGRGLRVARRGHDAVHRRRRRSRPSRTGRTTRRRCRRWPAGSTRSSSASGLAEEEADLTASSSRSYTPGLRRRGTGLTVTAPGRDARAATPPAPRDAAARAGDARRRRGPRRAPRADASRAAADPRHARLRWRIARACRAWSPSSACWAVAAAIADRLASLLPTPARDVGTRFVELWHDGVLSDRPLGVGSTHRCIGYAISVAIGVVLGLAIGTFASVEAFFEPQFGFLRYIPASALTPLFLLWLGIDESPKIWLIVVGTRLLQHPDDRRRRPRRAAGAAQRLVHARRRAR